MSLFGGLFNAAAAAPASGLFAASSKYAAAPAAIGLPPGETGRPSAAAPAAGGSGKKRRKQAAAEPAAAAPAPAGKEKHVSKKARKGEQQQQLKQQQDKQAEAAAAAAAAAGGMGQSDEQPGKQRVKQKKQKKAADGKAAKAAAGKAAEDKDAKAAQPAEGKAAKAAKPADGKAAKPAKAAEGKATKAAKPAAADAKPAAAKPAVAEGNPADGDGSADDARLPRTVFVGNLASGVKRKALARLFGGCGTVESVRLRSLPLKQDAEGKVAKMPRRGAIASGAVDADHSAHAYVVFEEERAAEAALALNMTEWEGRHIRVDRATPKGGKGAVVFDPLRSLFVGNLAHDVEDEAVIQHFGAGAVEAVRVVRDSKTGAGKGVAFVLFRTQEASRLALQGLQGRELGGRKLRLTRVQRQAPGGAAGGASGGKAAAWQQGKASSAKEGVGKGSKKSVNKPVAGKRKAGGKRPAVAARRRSAGGAGLAPQGGVRKVHGGRQ